LPRGLFRSADFGVSWNLVYSLWLRAERVEWFGGGYDVPGIHSICPHPPHAGDVRLGISCCGARCSLAGSWQSLRLCAVLSARPWSCFSSYSNFRGVWPNGAGMPQAASAPTTIMTCCSIAQIMSPRQLLRRPSLRE
jgi:hypothetical protein